MQNHLMRFMGIVHTFRSSKGVLTRVSKYPMYAITPAIRRQINAMPCFQYKEILLSFLVCV